MHRVEEVDIGCPYCGEMISVLIDGSISRQEYIEDCEVCCRPIVLAYTIEGDEVVSIEVRQEDD